MAKVRKETENVHVRSETERSTVGLPVRLSLCGNCVTPSVAVNSFDPKKDFVSSFDFDRHYSLGNIRSDAVQAIS